jgi:DNA-binding HxlR family transcriptional regulator
MRDRATKEEAILWCLRRAPEGLDGLKICAITGIWRISIYQRLSKLIDRGLVRVVSEPGPYPQRGRYFATTSEERGTPI